MSWIQARSDRIPPSTSLFPLLLPSRPRSTMPHLHCSTQPLRTWQLPGEGEVESPGPSGPLRELAGDGAALTAGAGPEPGPGLEEAEVEQAL